MATMVWGGMTFRKHEDEDAYAAGYSKEGWEASKSKIKREVAKEFRDKEDLAKAIAREMKK
jgi:hypothetical protein